ncbi:hypothetical protein Tco_0135730 [Tanacetum coccineum]
MLAGLGYVNLSMQYHYKIPNDNLDNGLLPLSNDNDGLLDRFKVIEVYVLHPVDMPKETDQNDNPDFGNDFDPFFCDIDNEMGQLSDMPTVSKPNVSERPNVSEPNEIDDVVSKHSDSSEESYDSDDSEDSDFDV